MNACNPTDVGLLSWREELYVSRWPTEPLWGLAYTLARVGRRGTILGSHHEVNGAASVINIGGKEIASPLGIVGGRRVCE